MNRYRSYQDNLSYEDLTGANTVKRLAIVDNRGIIDAMATLAPGRIASSFMGWGGGSDPAPATTDPSRDPNNPDAMPPTTTFGIGTEWTCKQWMMWHAAMKKKNGKAAADAKWLTAWNDQNFFNTAYSWCKYDTTFNAWQKAEALGVSNLVADTTVGATKIIQNTTNAGVNTANFLKYAIPVTLGLAIVGGGWWAYNKFIK